MSSQCIRRYHIRYTKLIGEANVEIFAYKVVPITQLETLWIFQCAKSLDCRDGSLPM